MQLVTNVRTYLIEANCYISKGLKAKKIFCTTIYLSGAGSLVPVTAFRLLAGLRPHNRYITTLDLSFCKLGNLLKADETMKV